MFDEAVYQRAAEQALSNWTLDIDKLTLSSRSENVVYKVTTQSSDNYALRIHRPGYNSIEELNSEVNWSQALRESGVYVPKHILTRDGKHYAKVKLEPTKQIHYVGLIEWLDGESLENLIKTSEKPQIKEYYFKLGELMAQVHNQSASWNPPKSFTRRKWDADGLMGDNPLWGRFWEVNELAAEERSLLEAARIRLHQEISEFEKTPSTYGIIHADLHAANVLVQGEKLQIIDFDDCGYSWHAYEIAVAETDASSKIKEDRISSKEIRSAMIDGYNNLRPLTATTKNQLSVLTLVRQLISLGWANDRRELISDEFFRPYIGNLCPIVESYLTDPKDQS